jgi:hypothetical protein
MSEIKQKNFKSDLFNKEFEDDINETASTEDIFAQYIQDLDKQILNLGCQSDTLINDTDLNFLDSELDMAIENLNKINKCHTQSVKNEAKYSGVKSFLAKYCN